MSEKKSHSKQELTEQVSKIKANVPAIARSLGKTTEQLCDELGIDELESVSGGLEECCKCDCHSDGVAVPE